MLLILENQKLSIDELTKSASDLDDFSPHAKYVIAFIVSWLNGSQSFQFQTSGSTGQPKTVEISRKVMEYSAMQTLQWVGIGDKTHHHFLLCINPRFIGGSMVIVRALIAKASLTVIPPSSQIDQEGPFTLASMVPLQVAQMLDQSSLSFKNYEHILIGGGGIDTKLEKKLLEVPTKCYHTFGMTETASHVALRPIGTRYYEALGDARFTCSEDGELSIQGTVTGHQSLQTNDLVRLEDATHFEWLGRSDFVINSGAYKVHPEKVEAILAGQLQEKFIITNVPDAKLGQRVVLMTEADPFELDLEKLHPYERPKNTYFNQEIVLTATGKINRMASRNKLLKSLNK